MNGFGRVGAHAFAMTLAALLLQGQAAVTIELGPAAPDPRIIGPLPLQLLSTTSDTPSEASLPIVGEGFASDTPVRGSLAPLVMALRSESYLDREEATHLLMRLPPDRLEDIVAALAEESDPEAISRLQMVAGHLFLKPRTNVKGQPGFLGVGAPGPFVGMMGMLFDDPAKMRVAGQGDVVVVRARELQLGFPAAQELRDGDCIAAIAGNGFPDEMVPDLISTDNLTEDAVFAVNTANREREEQAKTMFQARVRTLLPGSVVDFTVVRDGKLVDVPVQLAAVQVKDGVGLSSLVELRNDVMEAFVAGLKTGEKAQGGSHAAEQRAASVGAFDRLGVQTKVLWGNQGGNLMMTGGGNTPERQ